MLRHSLILSLLLTSSISTAQASEPKTQKLFNGKDFAGWKEPKTNIWWTIQDEVLSVKSDPKKQGSTLWTKKEYRDFDLSLDFRFGEGTVDSGVFVRNDKEQIQIGISGSLKRDMTGSPYIVGKGYPVEAEGIKKLLKMRDWNTLRIQAVGKVYTIWLNGKQVLEYNSDTAIEQGPLGLQLHAGKKMQIDFRNITLAELPAKSTKPE